MYEKYHTEAIVLRSSAVGEADAVLALYTRDFGLVNARAAGGRKEVSKMRYAIQKYAYASISLVRGARGWRAAGARSLSSALHHPQAARAYARVLDLASRLIAGEECNEHAFEVLSSARTALLASPDDAESIELLAVARLLFALGYLPSVSLPEGVATSPHYDAAALAFVVRDRETLLTQVNRALSETHL